MQSLERGVEALAAGQAQLRAQLAGLEADRQASSPSAAGLLEQPTAGVVRGYCGQGLASTTEPPAFAAPSQEPYERLIAGRAPTVELVGNDEQLGSASDASLGAIVAREVVERIPPDRVPEFFGLARRKLRDDGLLIVETPNAHADGAFKAFWAAPSNTRPLFPEAALALCRQAGFRSAFVFHPGGSGNVEADRLREHIYALVAAPGEDELGLRGPDGEF